MYNASDWTDDARLFFQISSEEQLNRRDVEAVLPLPGAILAEPPAHLLKRSKKSDQFRRLRELFDSIDEDGEGTVSKEELGLLISKQLNRYVSDEELRRVINIFDTAEDDDDDAADAVPKGDGEAKGDGEIDFEEFCTGMEKLGIEDVKNVKDALLKMLSVHRTHLHVRHTEPGGGGRRSEFIYVRQQLQADSLLQLIKADFKPSPPNVMVCCDAARRTRRGCCTPRRRPTAPTGTARCGAAARQRRRVRVHPERRLADHQQDPPSEADDDVPRRSSTPPPTRGTGSSSTARGATRARRPSSSSSSPCSAPPSGRPSS